MNLKHSKVEIGTTVVPGGVEATTGVVEAGVKLGVKLEVKTKIEANDKVEAHLAVVVVEEVITRTTANKEAIPFRTTANEEAIPPRTTSSQAKRRPKANGTTFALTRGKS